MGDEDRLQMLKAFDDTKAGVKGLCDTGLVKLPKMFVRPSHELAQEEAKCEKSQAQVQIPVIDMSDINDGERRRQILEEVRNASQNWGFFQVVNHGIPVCVLQGMIDGARGFHEQDVEEKKKYYTRDSKKLVMYSSSHDLFTAKTANWKDTLTISINSGSDFLNPEELPSVCRDSAAEYSKHVEKLGNIILGLLSESLGLESGGLERMECSKGHRLVCHYYPACPEPELAIGTMKHSDAGFLTILLQNQVSGLQFMHQGHWIDIQPLQGALVVNIGDLLQLVSNGKLRSNEHRAIANGDGPRVSVACFFSGPVYNSSKVYGPIKEMVTKENPANYREIVLGEYIMKFLTTALDSYRALDYYRVA